MSVDRRKKALELFGKLLSLLSIVFIVERLYAYHESLDGDVFRLLIIPIVVLSVVYALSGTLTAFAWREALGHVGVLLDRRVCVRVYGVSQIAKYIPGNFFHLLGRQAIGMTEGIPAAPLAKSMAWELGLLCLAAVLFLSFQLPALVPRLDLGWAALTVIYLTGFIASVIVLYSYVGRQLAYGLLYNSVFLAFSGIIFAVLVRAVFPGLQADFSVILHVVSAFIIAWLAGFITPGAPAGLGIREVVVYALLGTLVSRPELLAAIVAARIVSVLGDCIFYLVSRRLGLHARSTA